METLEIALKKFLISVINALHPLKRISPGDLPLSLIKRILIVKQHDQLGDLLVTTPAIRAVRKRFPGASIAIVVREYTVPLMWENTNVDDIILFRENLKRWNWQMLKAFWNQLRSGGGFDCAIVFNSVSRSFSSDLIAALSKATYIVGPNHIPLEQGMPERVYNVQTLRSRKVQHEAEHYLDIVRQIGVKPDGLEYDLQLTADEESEADRILFDVGVRAGVPWIGVHFGALNRDKRLPFDKLAKAIEWMKAHYDCEIMLIVGPNEVRHSNELMNRFRKREVIPIPLQPLRTSCAVIKKLHLLLCNDTGTMHIASACKVATVSFHSISDPVQWKPPHERHIALRAADKRIGSITLEMITTAIQTQLEKLRFKQKEF